jgi:hypothetical protein
MNEILTIEEIKARFAPDWVLIGEPETDEAQRLRAGKVLFHSPNRDDVYQKAIDLRLDHFAFRFLGNRPEDMAFLVHLDNCNILNMAPAMEKRRRAGRFRVRS